MSIGAAVLRGEEAGGWDGGGVKQDLTLYESQLWRRFWRNGATLTAPMSQLPLPVMWVTTFLNTRERIFRPFFETWDNAAMQYNKKDYKNALTLYKQALGFLRIHMNQIDPVFHGDLIGYLLSWYHTTTIATIRKVQEEYDAYCKEKKVRDTIFRPFLRRLDIAKHRRDERDYGNALNLYKQALDFLNAMMEKTSLNIHDDHVGGIISWYYTTTKATIADVQEQFDELRKQVLKEKRQKYISNHPVVVQAKRERKRERQFNNRSEELIGEDLLNLITAPLT